MTTSFIYSPFTRSRLSKTILAYCDALRRRISSDNPVFKQAGVSRDYVYHKLVERASELVRREYLIPRISSIQALVILCSQPTYSTSSYRNWILAGMAVRMVSCYLPSAFELSRSS